MEPADLKLFTGELKIHHGRVPPSEWINGACCVSLCGLSPPCHRAARGSVLMGSVSSADMKDPLLKLLRRSGDGVRVLIKPTQTGITQTSKICPPTRIRHLEVHG